MKQKIKHIVVLGLAGLCVAIPVWLQGTDFAGVVDVEFLYVVAAVCVLPYLKKIGIAISNRELREKLDELEEKQNGET